MSNSTSIPSEKLARLEALVATRKRAGIDRIGDATYGQRALLHLHDLDPSSAAYNTVFACRIQAAVVPERFAAAANAVVQKYSALRSTYRVHNGKYLRLVHREPRIDFETIDASGRSHDEIRRIALRDARAPFELAKTPIRVRLYVRNRDVYLLVGIHHIAIDARSMLIVIDDLFRAYAAGQAEPASLGVELVPYDAFVDWEASQAAEPRSSATVAYWAKALQDVPAALEVPTDFPRAIATLQARAGAGATIVRSLPSEVVSSIGMAAKRMGILPAALYLAAYQIVLSRYSGQSDIVIVTPMDIASQLANRRFARTVGYCVNMVPIRARVDSHPSLASMGAAVTTSLMDALAHADLPFPLLVEKLNLSRDSARNSLFQAQFNYIQAPPSGLARLMLSAEADCADQANEANETDEADRADQASETDDAIDVHGVAVSPFVVPQQEGQFEFSMTCARSADSLQVHLSYNDALFGDSTAAGIADAYVDLLRAMDRSSDPTIEQTFASLQTRAEPHLLALGRGPDVPSGAGDLVSLVQEQAVATPERVAVDDGVRRWTYAELENASDRIASALTEAAGAGALVGIRMRPSAATVATILGVLKARCAYVPLDARYPKERYQYILADSGVAVVVVDDDDDEGDASVPGTRRLSYGELSSAPARRLPPPASTDLAYVIYTSGSTGKPKGVAIEHASASAFIRWTHGEFAEDPIDEVIWSTSICFDLSIFEIFYTLTTGRLLRVVASSLEIPQAIRHRARVLVNTVPSVAKELLASGTDLSPVSVLNLAGEPIPLWVLAALKETGIRVRNLYGPSEDTTYSTFHRFTDDWSGAWIGKPVGGTRVYIVDEARRLVPRGAAGEIALAGEGLARGYWNRDELTNERFVACPFEPGRMYLTGDIGRWRSNDVLEFLGRRDGQIKLRGFRIELGDLEANLMTFPGVTESVVVAQTHAAHGAEGGDPVLVGFVAASDAREEDLRAHLASRVPVYMVPSRIVVLDQLPRTPNGKVDKKALPVAVAVRSAPKSQPSTVFEHAVVGIWKDILGVEIDVEATFFESGGSSLQLVRVQSALQALSGRPLAIVDLYKYPTVRALARFLEEGAREVQNGQTAPKAQSTEPAISAEDRASGREAFLRSRRARNGTQAR